MEKSEHSRGEGLFIFAFVWAFYCLITVPLLPFSDDWNYPTSPQCFFTLSDLLPGDVVWRPLDTLFGALLGLAPSLFPVANHVAVTFGHVLGGYFTCRILRRLFLLKKRDAALATGFFLFAAGTFTAVASIDSLNQVYASTFGIMAFYCFILFKERAAVRYYVLSMLLCALAALAKENGLVWFVVIPLLHGCGWLTAQQKTAPDAANGALFKTLKEVAAGLLCCAVYFGVRFALAGSVALGADEGSYEVTLSLRTLARFVTLAAGAFTFVDSVALFVTPRNDLLLAVTVLLSLPFLVWLAVSGCKAFTERGSRLSFVTLLVAASLMTLPNILTTVGEMHAYLLVFFGALLIGFFLKHECYSGKMILVAVFSTALLSSAIVGAHKWRCLRDMGLKTRVVNDVIQSAYEGEKPPDKVLLIKVMDEKKGYSLFAQPVAFSSYYGYSARALWQWRHPAKMRGVAVTSVGEKDEAIKSALAEDDSYDAIWVIRANGACEIIKR